MTNDEFLMTKEIRDPNDKGRKLGLAETGLAFGLCHSFVIRHSDFVIVQCLLIPNVSSQACQDPRPQRFGGVAKSRALDHTRLRDERSISRGGEVRTGVPNAPGRRLGALQYCRTPRGADDRRIFTIHFPLNAR
jgi:hypothetical protein